MRMRAYVLLSLTITLASAFPRGPGSGADHGNRKGPKDYGHGYDKPNEVQYGPGLAPESKYGKLEHVYTKHEVVVETTCTTPEPVYTKHDMPYSNPAPIYTKPTSTLTCPTTCRLDFHGTFLEYPTIIEWSSEYAETINAFITGFEDGSPAQTREETITASAGPAAAPMTWEAFGVQLLVDSLHL
jgi:hypothetical protein